MLAHMPFTPAGGYIEFSVKLPGNAQDSGFWAATWIMGNLGRAGYYPSLEGIWPFSYDACTDGSKGHEWNNYKTQRITRCNGTQGKG
jgi:beta-glucanase (GH16 family)